MEQRASFELQAEALSTEIESSVVVEAGLISHQPYAKDTTSIVSMSSVRSRRYKPGLKVQFYETSPRSWTLAEMPCTSTVGDQSLL